MKTTQRILEQMRAGEREAFDRFFDRFAARLLVYINYNLGPRLRRKLDAADVLQNVHLKLYQNFASFSTRAQRLGVKTALIRMADHEISEAYRYHFKVEKRDAQRELTAVLDSPDGHAMDPLEWAPADSTSISARVSRQEEYQRVMGLLRQLSPIEQYITVARTIEGVPAREIAARLGKTRQAVQMILTRARDKLRQRAVSRDDDRRGATPGP